MQIGELKCRVYAEPGGSAQSCHGPDSSAYLGSIGEEIEPKAESETGYLYEMN